MSAPVPDVVGLGLVTVDDLYVIDEIPTFGESGRARERSQQCGGPVPTALAALSRLGVQTRFLGRLGDDADGDFILDELRRFGVDVSLVEREPGARSRRAVVLVESGSGERGFLTLAETCAPLGADELSSSLFSDARVLHLDDADEVEIAAARMAKGLGLTVTWDGTWQHADLDLLLPLVDYAIVSEYFARRWMPWAADEAILRALVERGAGHSVLTLGERGSLALSAGEYVRVPTHAVKARDTTGAGDAYHGSFIYGLLQEWPLDRVMRFASAVGALNCRQLGGQRGLPTLHQVEKFLNRLSS
ncbi:MAG: PfkB family carbohydrate kinase [Candidatus Latescibacterota bacterium]|nr:PfkB family carbohydrate kinase [Candidatus Latescibacterota bacterium]